MSVIGVLLFLPGLQSTALCRTLPRGCPESRKTEQSRPVAADYLDESTQGGGYSPGGDQADRHALATSVAVLHTPQGATQ